MAEHFSIWEKPNIHRAWVRTTFLPSEKPEYLQPGIRVITSLVGRHLKLSACPWATKEGCLREQAWYNWRLQPLGMLHFTMVWVLKRGRLDRCVIGGWLKCIFILTVCTQTGTCLLDMGRREVQQLQVPGLHVSPFFWVANFRWKGNVPVQKQEFPIHRKDCLWHCFYSWMRHASKSLPVHQAWACSGRPGLMSLVGT